MDLDRWVNDNNPDEQLQYSKGWWDYIELIRRLMYKFGAKEAQVVATYPMCTISRNGPARFRVNGPTLHGLPAEPRFESSTRPFSLRQVFWL
jgi:hypothetical protein